MATTIMFATGFSSFEKEIVKELNNRTAPGKYLSVFSATHLDDIVQMCLRLRPQIIVMRDSMTSPGQDFLELVRQLKMSVTGLRIIILTKRRPPGDPLMTGLMTYNIYDVLAREEFSVDDVVKLIMNPRTMQDMAAYVPKVSLKNDSSMLSFEAGDESGEAEVEGGTVLNDIDGNGTENVLHSESVNHTEKLTDIRETKETSLYTEAKPAGPVTLHKGVKLGYHPMFTAVIGAPEVEQEEPIKQTSNKPVSSQTVAIHSNSAPQPAVKPTVVEKPSPDFSVHQQTKSVVNPAATEPKTNRKPAQVNTALSIGSQSSVHKPVEQSANQQPIKKVQSPIQTKQQEAKNNAAFDKPYFQNHQSGQQKSQPTSDKKGSEMNDFNPKDAIKQRVQGMAGTAQPNLDTDTPPVHPKKPVRDQKELVEAQRRAAQETPSAPPLRPKKVAVGQPQFKQPAPIVETPAPQNEVPIEEETAVDNKPAEDKVSVNISDPGVTSSAEKITEKPAETVAPAIKPEVKTIPVTDPYKTNPIPTTVKQKADPVNVTPPKKEISPHVPTNNEVSIAMLSLFNKEELQQMRGILKAIILRHSEELLEAAMGEQDSVGEDREAFNELLKFSKEVNKAAKSR